MKDMMDVWVCILIDVSCIEGSLLVDLMSGYVVNAFSRSGCRAAT